MALISLKDYAKKNNVSYEAVRQQVVRYADELCDHIVKDGRQQFLDDKAVAFLDEKRKKNPVVIEKMDRDEEIENLRREKENLLIQYAELSKKNSELSDWKSENALLIAKAENSVALIEQKQQALDNLQKQYEEQGELLADYKEMKNEQNKQIVEFRKKIEEKDKIIEEYQKKEAEEAQKSKWQRFLGLWR